MFRMYIILYYRVYNIDGTTAYIDIKYIKLLIICHVKDVRAGGVFSTKTCTTGKALTPCKTIGFFYLFKKKEHSAGPIF